MQDGYDDLQAAFVDLCLHGYACLFVDVLCGCVTCAVTEDSMPGHHLKILFFLAEITEIYFLTFWRLEVPREVSAGLA